MDADFDGIYGGVTAVVRVDDVDQYVDIIVVDDDG